MPQEPARKFTVYFDGHLTTASPFANSPAGNRGRDDEALLPRLPINIGGAFVEVPVVQSATIRGRVRRAAALLLLDRFVQAGEEVTFDDWLLWAVGGVKGSGKEDLDARKRQSIIESSCLLAMFGAGDSPAGGMVGGRFFIDPGIPNEAVETSVIKGARAAENRNPALVEFLSPDEMDRVQAYTDANRERSALDKAIKKLNGDIVKAEKAVKEKRQAALSPEELEQAKAERDRLTARLATVAEIAASMGSDNSIGRPLSGYEVIPPGVVFPHRMVIKAASMSQIGFVVEALREFAIDPVIGAHVSHGCGRITASYDVRVRVGRERQVQAVGKLSYGGFEGLEAEGSFLGEATQAWLEHDFNPQAYRAA